MNITNTFFGSLIYILIIEPHKYITSENEFLIFIFDNLYSLIPIINQLTDEN